MPIPVNWYEIQSEYDPIKVKFLLKKIFSGNLNHLVNVAILLLETDVTLRVMSVPAIEIASFRLSWKIFLKKKLTFTFVVLSWKKKY